MVANPSPANPELLTAMLEGCLAFAREMLEKAGAFYPFGETADAAGQRAMAGAHDGQAHPNPQDLYRLLEHGFRDAAQSGRITAAALAVDVNIPPEYDPVYPDGVRVLIEAPGYSRFIYTPYQVAPQTWANRLLRKKRSVTFAEPFAVEIPPQLNWPVA